jgi:hypothetical protein
LAGATDDGSFGGAFRSVRGGRGGMGAEPLISLAFVPGDQEAPQLGRQWNTVPLTLPPHTTAPQSQ